ncbi:MAG: hypothetical protein KJ630_08915 [Proteobacteria bacterium]|nr:hypothetical protein [Pseudomonadota bacterium]
MRPDPTFEQIAHRRIIRRRIFLILALFFIGCAYVALAILPETSMGAAIPRGFLGIGLLLAGLIFAMLAWAVP